MSVSFKREPARQIVRRDGRVEDRTTGTVLGVVRQGRDGRWQHSESVLLFGWPTRADAVAALARQRELEARAEMGSDQEGAGR